MYADSARISQLSESNHEFGSLGDESVDDDLDDLVDPSYVSILDGLDGINQNNVDLYAILGVSHSATDKELRSAYRRLSLLLHPDKHLHSDIGDDTILSADAESAFGRVASAYSILSDPKKRRIYDQFGYKVFMEHGQQLASCSKSEVEVRMEYLLLKQKVKESRQLELTQPSSEFSIGFDMTEIFDDYLKASPDERLSLPLPHVYELVLAQSITAGVNLRNSVSLAGQVIAHNGLGVGTGLILWRHNCGNSFFLGPVIVDTEISYGRGGRGLCTALRLRRAFGQRFVGTMGFSLGSYAHNSKIVIAPDFSTGLNIQLMPRTHARIELRCLRDAGLSSELLWTPESEVFSVRLSAKLNQLGSFGLSFRIERPVSWSWLNPPIGSIDESCPEDSSGNWDNDEYDEFKLNKSKKGVISFLIGMNSDDFVELALGAHCHVSSHSRFSGLIRLSLEQGVSLKLSLLRGSQTYSFPFKLSENPDLIAIGYGFLVPFVAFAAIKTLVYVPYLQKQLRRAEKARRIKLFAELNQKRREAFSIQRLMQHAASRSKYTESSISGLIIDQAIYGVLNESDSMTPDVMGHVTVDVTVPLQTMVENSKLKLPPGQWSDLQGFYDPSVGLSNRTNQLRVFYTFQEASHEVVVSDNQGLAIPMSKHKIELLRRL